jgi:DNA (cytosine-5)-methyltransferase 1
MKLLDLFSGVGGFSLGLERSSYFKTAAFCEIEPYCRAVLKQHWPNVPCYEDIRTLTAKQLRDDGIAIDAMCGGFPCQDISYAGKGAGIEGERSGLWNEYARLIGEIRPKLIIVENTPALLGRGIGRVLGDLASLGYDAEWSNLPACALGFTHPRQRLFIVAYAPSQWREQCGRLEFNQSCEAARDLRERLHQSEPVRVVNGISHRMERLAALGNAVVPQVAELIGEAIGRMVRP